jgi:hypothetical protein
MVPGRFACSDMGALRPRRPVNASERLLLWGFGRLRSPGLAWATESQPRRRERRTSTRHVCFQQPRTGLNHASSMRHGPHREPAWALPRGSATGQTAVSTRHTAWSGGRLGGTPALGGPRPGPDTRSGRVASSSGCTHLPILRAEWVGAAGAVAETWSGGGPGPPPPRAPPPRGAPPQAGRLDPVKRL